MGILQGYSATREFLELKVRQHERGLSLKETIKMMDFDVGGRRFIFRGLPEIIGFHIFYFLNPHVSIKGVMFHILDMLRGFN